MKLYLASPISQTYEKLYAESVAKKVEKLGYDVYAAHRNTTINDKTRNPTSKDIYHHDVLEIYDSDVLLVNLNGSRQEGTIFELGVVAGINYERVLNHLTPIIQITYTTNTRLMNPQVEQAISNILNSGDSLNVPSACANHLVLGSAKVNGDIVTSEENAYKLLKIMKEDSRVYDSLIEHIKKGILDSFLNT